MLIWVINGYTLDNAIHQNKGYVFNTTYGNGNASSIFQTPCNPSYNNTVVECSAFAFGNFVTSDDAVLLLQGEYNSQLVVPFISTGIYQIKKNPERACKASCTVKTKVCTTH